MRLKDLVVIMLCFLITSSFFVIFFNEQCRASGNEIYVDNDFHIYRDGTAEHPYQSIREAIDLANEGDTIYVFGGEYNETLSINKKITIIGSISNGNTILSYNIRHKYTVEITTDYVTFEGFNIADNGNNIISDVKGSLIHITSDNVIIQRNNITNCRGGWGIYLDSSNGHVIGDNFINNTEVGIYLSSSNTNDLINNIISNCTNAAVEIQSSNNNRLYNNHLIKSNYGVYARKCSYINISSNTIDSNYQHGIGLYQNNNDVIKNNIISNNDINGIHLDSFNSKIIGNTLENNQIGINLDQSNCEIRSNFINNSNSAGIFARSGSENSIIYLNHFNGNDFNAKDNGANHWDGGAQGNYWDDYNEIDRDLNGIGDTFYTTVGGGKDRYPLGIFLEPPNKPSNPLPEDDAEDVGLKITLSVDVQDPEDDIMTVYFYNAADDELYGVGYPVLSGNTASCSFNLDFDTTFAWYTKVNDSKLENQSDIWFFTTKQRPPENEKPVSDPGGPYTSIIGGEIDFSASDSYDPDGNIDFYRWNFGDGTSEILDLYPKHSYSESGIYTITLTVVDSDGRSSTETTTATISNSTNALPVPVLNTPNSSNANELITFGASDSYDKDGTITNYTWDFGDGTVGYGVSAGHTYSTAGTYVVTLTVIDDDGDEDTNYAIVIVNTLPEETPGFELILVVIAMAFILFRKRRRG
ncbi:MAG: right-handed parallel beta-helix repeat-containing protein [Thermoplasmatales archaeon]|nr:right-handed parallel beta-helix repeat-containing protein [Thermoplasmatales archaeon]